MSQEWVPSQAWRFGFRHGGAWCVLGGCLGIVAAVGGAGSA